MRMRGLIIGLLIIITHSSYGQRVDLFTDSLALDLNRTWVDINGSNFTKLGGNCNFGIEVTFIKLSNRVIFFQCHEGEWKIFEYRFEVKSIDGEHFVELYDNDIKLEDYEFEVQMIADNQDNFITELTLFYFRDKRTYTLRSKK